MDHWEAEFVMARGGLTCFASGDIARLKAADSKAMAKSLMPDNEKCTRRKRANIPLTSTGFSQKRLIPGISQPAGQTKQKARGATHRPCEAIFGI